MVADAMTVLQNWWIPDSAVRMPLARFDVDVEGVLSVRCLNRAVFEFFPPIAVKTSVTVKL